MKEVLIEKPSTSSAEWYTNTVTFCGSSRQKVCIQAGLPRQTRCFELYKYLLMFLRVPKLKNLCDTYNCIQG
jgi:hypothetical protein